MGSTPSLNPGGVDGEIVALTPPTTPMALAVTFPFPPIALLHVEGLGPALT